MLEDVSFVYIFYWKKSLLCPNTVIRAKLLSAQDRFATTCYTGQIRYFQLIVVQQKKKKKIRQFRDLWNQC